MLRIKYFFITIKVFFKGLRGLVCGGVLINYCIENNAGDRFNAEFPLLHTGRRVSKYSFGARKHLVFCGSVLSRSNNYSTIVGAGFISSEQSKRRVQFDRVIGVRGKLTRNALEAHSMLANSLDFMGDPGLLSREIVPPLENANVDGPVGLIPHFIHLEEVKKMVHGSQGFLVIDIKDSFVNVCENVKKCSVILSSSLHGLIFSDAMNVPNTWVTFGDGVKGGKFKFLDYYSVMTNPKGDWIECNIVDDLHVARQNSTVSVNPSYELMKASVERILKERG